MGSSSSSESPLRARTRQQEVVADLGERALETDDMDALLREAAAGVADALDVQRCQVLERLPGGTEALLRQGVGWRPGLIGTVAVPTDGASLAGAALDAGEAVVVADVRTDGHVAAPELVTDGDVVSAVAVPIGPASDPWGVLEVDAGERREFGDHEIHFLRSVAGVVGSAVRRAEASTERERKLEWYERLAERLPVGVYRNTPGPDGEFVEVNDAMLSIFGADSEAELLGSTVSDLYPDPEKRAEFSRQLEREGIVEDVELKQETLDGRDIWISVTAMKTVEDGETYFDGVVHDVTERKRAQQRLEEERDMFADGPAVVFRWIPDEAAGWPVEYVSGNVEDVLGYAPEELESGEVPYADLLLDEERDRIAREVREATESGTERFSHEPYRIRTRDGDVRWVKNVTKIVRGDDGGVDSYLGYVVDITERKERERRLSRLIDNVPGMVYRCSNKRGWPMEFVSDACEELTGHDPAALERGEVSWGEDVMVETDRDMVWETVQAEVCETGTFSETYRIETADGETRWVRDYGRGVFDEDGTLAEIEGIIADVTDRKRLESELDEIFGRISDAFYAVDENFRFTHVNDRAEELLGYDRDELVGKRIDEVYPETGETKQIRDVFGTAMETQESTTLEHHSDLLDLWVEATVYPSENGVSMYFRDISERKERERELAESEHRYRTLVEHFPNGAVGLVDDDLRYRTVGGDPVDVADVTVDEVEGSYVGDVLPEKLADELVPRYEAALEGESDSFETEFGGQIYQFQVVPVRDEDGDAFAALGMSQDITERRERERELAESERRYRTLAEYFPNGIVTLFDEDFEYELAAGQGFDRIPVAPDDVEGHHVREVWDEATADVLEPAFEEALDGKEVSVELEDAGREWVIRVVPIRDERGEVFAGMTMAQDITERKERERYLEDAKSQLEAATEAGAVGTWDWDVEADEMVAGPTFARTFDVDPEAAREGVSLDRFVDAIHEDDRERVEREIETALDACGEYEAEYRVRDADGEVRWVVARGRVECDEDGDPVRFPGALTDITERKRAELELQRHTEQLETLFEVLPVGVVVADAEGSMVEANDTAREIWGSDVFDAESVADYARYPVWEADTGERVAPGDMTLARVIDGEEVTDPDVYEIETTDGERRIVRAEGMPVRNERGEVTRGVVTLTDVTERREAQRKLEESERRYRTLAEHFPNGAMALFDEDLEYQIAGGEVLDELDTSTDEIVGQTVWDRYPEDLAEKMADRFEAALAGEESAFEMDFHDRHWSAHTVPVEDEDGNTFAGMMMVQDVTERKMRERALRERERALEKSERRYRTLAENFPNGAVGVYDDDLRFTLAAGSELGDSLPSAERIEGAHFTDTFPDDVVDDLVPMYRAAVEDGEDDRTTVEIADRIWQVWATPLRDADGDIFAGLTFAQDITEQIERERELERALDLLEKTERIADVAGWEVDPETREPYWSDHLFDILGVDYNHQPTLDQALDVYHTEDREIVAEAVEEALESGESFDVVARFSPPSGDVGRLRVQGEPEVEDGEVVSLRGAVQDVTEQIERERQLEELVEELEESNERLEQFAYAASHDLQEPLRMVSSYLQLIESRYADELDEEGQEFIDFAVDGADRMRDMINGLLEYSRVETRGDPFEPVDLGAVLDDVRHDLQVKIEESGAEITAVDLPRVEGDRGQLRQVFQNLVDNAVEYSGESPPRIRVDAARRGDRWRVSVSDEGVGIDPDDADRVFEVFQRLHSRDEHSGTGIGLALVERIVERHGGDIWVESEPGEGSTFTFTLPAVDEAD